MLDLDRDLQASENQAREALRVVRESKRSGEPLVLIINGQASLTIRDDRSFEMLLDLVRWNESLSVVQISLKEFEEGKGIELDEARRLLLATHDRAG